MTKRSRGNQQERAKTLMSAEAELGISYLGTVRGGAAFEVQHGGRRVEIDAEDVPAWLDGFRAAASAAGAVHLPVDGTAGLADLFEGYRLADQCRLHLLSAMERDKVTIARMAELVGLMTKTVSESLKFGRPRFSMDVADAMIAALGRHWVVTTSPIGAVLVPAEEVQFADWIARLRRMLTLHRRGWLAYGGPENPNLARPSLVMAGRAPQFKLAVGQRSYTVASAQADAWLDGLSFYHGE